MDPDDEGVVEAARAIRPYLDRLVESAAAAADLDRQLADELGQVSDPAAGAQRLRILLEQHEDTAWFLDKVLADAPDYRPPYHQPGYRTRGIASPPGMRCPSRQPGTTARSAGTTPGTARTSAPRFLAAGPTTCC